MIRSLLKHEFTVMCRSKKNILFIIFLSVLLLSYCFIILPNEQTPDSFDPELEKQELEEMARQQEARIARDATGFGYFTGRSVFATTEYYYNLHSKMVKAYEDEDFTRLLLLKTYAHEAGLSSFNEELEEEFMMSPFPGKDRMHLYNKTLFRYQEYLEKDTPISYAMIEQKTAMQTLQNILFSTVTYLFLFAAIYFSSDIVTRDRKNQTILQGFPMPWYRWLNIKTTAGFIYSTTILLGFMIAGIGILTLINGFGFFNTQIPVVTTNGNIMLEDYDFMSFSEFLLKASSFIVIIVYLFTRLNVLFSLLFKNQWIVLFLSTIILFSERIYYSRSKRELFGFDISNFPQTYFEFGKVITGEKIFLLNIDTITYTKGITVLLITIIIIEVLLVLVSRIVNKRRFYA